MGFVKTLWTIQISSVSDSSLNKLGLEKKSLILSELRNELMYQD